MNHSLRSSRRHSLQTGQKFTSKLMFALVHPRSLWAPASAFCLPEGIPGCCLSLWSGSSKGPWFPSLPPISAIVPRSAFAVMQASGLIKTPKGSNPWVPLKDLQLLPFMKKAGCGGRGGALGPEGGGKWRIWTRASYPNTAPITTRTELCFISLSFPASFQKLSLPRTPANSCL